MVFSSIIFILFFLPIFLLCYFVSPRKIRNYVLLGFSVLFYAWGAPWFVLFLTGSTVVNFYIIRAMDKSKTVFWRKLFLGASIAINLGLLLYFKYANFFIENVNFVREWIHLDPMMWNYILLPIGISFFSFQSITYSVDVYRRIHKPLSNPFTYMLYIMMFPQMIAGPIIRYQDIADQFTQRKEKWDEFLHGFYRFVLGLAKKVLIADVIAMEVDKILDLNYVTLDSSTAWIGILGYTFQLYFDFSGYSDMAIGVGRMIGFKFPENFDNPYVAKSVSEFWRRWHITFSVFMRNYLYYPLGGSRVDTKRRLYFNLWFVFLLSGLWHGASWNFVIYGAFHGFFLVLERIFLLKFWKKIGTIPSIIGTFLIIVMARVFFRIETLSDSIDFFGALFRFDFQRVALSENPHFYVMMAVAVLFSFITLSKFGLKLQERFYFSTYSNKQHLFHWMLSIFLLVISIASLTGSGFSPFIYFRF